MGVDFSQQGLSRMTCRLCTARHMPCSKFDLDGVEACCGAAAGWRLYAWYGAELVQHRATRLVRVRVAPQRSACIRQRASAVHGRCAVVHAVCRAYISARIDEVFTYDLGMWSETD